MTISPKTIRFSFLVAIFIAAAFFIYYTQAGLFKPNISPVNDLKSGLVGYWTFDGQDTNWGTNTTNDKSGNGYNGTMVNMSTMTSPVAGVVGQALNLNGINNYINTNNDLDITGDMTLSAWVFRDTNTTRDYIASDQDPGDINIPWSFEFNNSADTLLFRQTNSTFTSSGTASTGQWNHVVAVRDNQNSRVTFYINNVQDSSGWQSYAPITLVGNDSSAKIGVRGDAAGGGSPAFDGKIDEVRIYNRALSTSEITELYNQGAKNLVKVNMPQTDLVPSGLVGYWTFDGQDTNWGTNTTNDRSGNNNNGTMTSMSTTTGPVGGVVGQALSFDGSSSSINITHNSVYDITSAITISVWVKLNQQIAEGGNRGIVNKGIGVPAVFSMKYDNLNNCDGNNTIEAWGGGGNACSSSNSLTLNEWQHVVYSSADNGTIYVNGVDKTAVRSAGSKSANSNTLYIGRMNSGSYFPGFIDEVRIYNRALSQSEITELYNQGAKNLVKINMPQTDLVTSGLVGYWTFNGQDTNWGTNTTNDVSGNNNHGVITAMSTSTSPAAGKVGQALSFDGSDDSITATDANSPTLDFSGAITMSVWLKMDSDYDGTGSVLDNFTGGASKAGFRMYSDIFTVCGDEDAVPDFCMAYGNGTAIGVNDNFELNKNQWYQVVMTHDGVDNYKFYKDGQLFVSGTASVTTTNTNNADFSIGFGTVGNFKGFIDEVRIYNRALSQLEVTELYNQGR